MPTRVARVDDSTIFVFQHAGDHDPWFALPGTTEFGNPRVLPVVALGGDWIHVLLPTRPNGSEGWVLKRQVTLSPVNDQVLVDLAARLVVWAHDGVVALETIGAIGSPASPTPVGQFFVTDVLPRSPGSAYGAWIVALDGHSDTFTEFDGGDARIAIHGTNDPSSIGEAVSSGCVRVAAEPLATLAAGLPLGTPVLIR
jgi:hypothetical protein